MPRRQADEGEHPYEIRSGIGVPNLRGMNRHDDPAGMKPNQHHLIVNGRLDGGEITERPGSHTHENTGYPGCITGMIEIEETGIGFWVTPAYVIQGGGTGPAPYTIMGNINEEAAVQFKTYNDEDTYEPPWTIGAVEKLTQYTAAYNNQRAWQSVVYFRRKYLQHGQRSVPKEQNPTQSDAFACLWSLDFPANESDGGPVGYDSYLNLWNRNTYPDRDVSSFAVTWDRSDDNVSGEVRIGETLYIGTSDGLVLVWDGSTLTESLDMGAPQNYMVRLGAWPGGLFAVGSNGYGAAKAYVLPEGATSWTQVTLPAADFHCVSMHSFNGKLYIFDAASAGRGCRLYVYDGETTLPAYSYEWPYTDVNNFHASAGLPFIYRNQLYVCVMRASGPQTILDLWKRVSDSSWSYVMELNWRQDFAFENNWVQVIGQRIIMGGLFIEKDIGQGTDYSGRSLIFELLPWSTGFRIIVDTKTAEHQGINVGNQAWVVVPSEELEDEEV